MVPRIDKGSVEYRIFVGRAINEETKKECVRFYFETIEEFNYFHYVITIDHTTNGSSLDFYLLGLKPKGMSLPSNGHATRALDFYDLSGKFDVTVHKQGASINKFQVNITKKKIQLTQPIKQKSPFISVALVS